MRLAPLTEHVRSMTTSSEICSPSYDFLSSVKHESRVQFYTIKVNGDQGLSSSRTTRVDDKSFIFGWKEISTVFKNTHDYESQLPNFIFIKNNHNLRMFHSTTMKITFTFLAILYMPCHFITNLFINILLYKTQSFKFYFSSCLFF